MSLPPCCAPLELRPLPSAGITQLLRYYEPLRHPAGPSWSSRIPGWRAHATDGASRVAAVSLLHACRRQYPGGTGRCPRHSLPDRCQPFPVITAGRLPHYPFRGLLSVHFAVAACVLAESPTGDPSSSECFSPIRCLLAPLRLLPAGATVAGRDSHPLGHSAFPRRMVNLG